MLSLYSLIWTFLISCPMLLLIFILRRRSDYLTKYGVTFIDSLHILYGKNAISDRISESSEGDM